MQNGLVLCHMYLISSESSFACRVLGQTCLVLCHMLPQLPRACAITEPAHLSLDALPEALLGGRTLPHLGQFLLQFLRFLLLFFHSLHRTMAAERRERGRAGGREGVSAGRDCEITD